jgi:CxC2 like cysteine cluster associated with KDZ transposases
LDELLRHDGLGSSLGQKGCCSCKGGNACWKCLDCDDGGLLRCQECIVTVHRSHALHRIEVWSLLCLEQFSHFLKKWNGLFFQKSSLHDSGLRIQLGHGGAKCITPTPGPITFTVVDISGIHNVAIDFCNCRTNGIIPHHIQLLRSGWFSKIFIMFLITSNFYEQVGFHRPSFALELPSHFAVLISTMN